MAYVNFNRGKSKAEIEALNNAPDGKIYFAKDGGGIYVGTGSTAVKRAVGPSDLSAGLAEKQDLISDLETIRGGAALGATSIQPAKLNTELAKKQDTIANLDTIISNAEHGHTAYTNLDGHTVAKNVPSDAVFTDDSVTSADNHYTPTANDSSKLTASGATGTPGATVQVVTAINRDAKGHVTGIVTGAATDTVFSHSTTVTNNTATDKNVTGSESKQTVITSITQDNTGKITTTNANIYSTDTVFTHSTSVTASGSTSYNITDNARTVVTGLTQNNDGSITLQTEKLLTQDSDTHYTGTLTLSVDGNSYSTVFDQQNDNTFTVPKADAMSYGTVTLSQLAALDVDKLDGKDATYFASYTDLEAMWSYTNTIAEVTATALTNLDSRISDIADFAYELPEFTNVLDEESTYEQVATAKAVYDALETSDRVIATSLNDLNSRISSISIDAGSENTPIYFNNGKPIAISYSIGNGTDNIPLSNGELNVNLNADKLDGKDATYFASADALSELDSYMSELSEVTATALVDLNERMPEVVTTLDENVTDEQVVSGAAIYAAFESNERVIANALNVLNTNINALSNDVFAAKTPVHTTVPNNILMPNIHYDLGTISSTTTFSLGAVADTTIRNVYSVAFKTGSTAPSIQWPNVTWKDSTAPTIEANKYYVITILHAADGTNLGKWESYWLTA